MAGGGDAKLQEIARTAKEVRKPLPRWLWVAALVIGVACAGAFAWLMLQEPGSPTTPPHREAGGPGFASGLLIGVLGGFVVGWTVARQRSDHSSRKSP